MSVKWLRKLEEHYPKIADQAHELNTVDNFTMYSKQKKRSSTTDDEDHSSSSASKKTSKKKKTS
jgi:hypothetical protein